MMIAELCQIYGWTYQEYISNPQWFLDLITRKYIIDGKRQEMNNRKK